MSQSPFLSLSHFLFSFSIFSSHLTSPLNMFCSSIFYFSLAHSILQFVSKLVANVCRSIYRCFHSFSSDFHSFNLCALHLHDHIGVCVSLFLSYVYIYIYKFSFFYIQCVFDCVSVFWFLFVSVVSTAFNTFAISVLAIFWIICSHFIHGVYDRFSFCIKVFVVFSFSICLEFQWVSQFHRSSSNKWADLVWITHKASILQ